MLHKKLILIGFMGAGKSTVAPLLAEALRFEAVDADERLLQISGYTSIAEIFAQKGERAFRELEARVATSLRDSSSVVIATGGGVIHQPENMHHLICNGGVVVFLRASFDEVTRRVKDISSRPLFKESTRAAALYHERMPIYCKYADLVVDTDGKTAKDVSSEIISLLQG